MEAAGSLARACPGSVIQHISDVRLTPHTLVAAASVIHLVCAYHPKKDSIYTNVSSFKERLEEGAGS